MVKDLVWIIYNDCFHKRGAATKKNKSMSNGRTMKMDRAMKCTTSCYSSGPHSFLLMQRSRKSRASRALIGVAPFLPMCLCVLKMCCAPLPLCVAGPTN